MANVFSRNCLKMVVALLCQSIGWKKINSTPMEVLIDLLENYIFSLGKGTYEYAEQRGSTTPVLSDLALALNDAGVSLPPLIEYMREVGNVPWPSDRRGAVPQYPAVRSAHQQNHVDQHLQFFMNCVDLDGDENPSHLVPPPFPSCPSTADPVPVEDSDRVSDLRDNSVCSGISKSSDIIETPTKIPVVAMTECGILSATRDGQQPSAHRPSSPPQGSPSPERQHLFLDVSRRRPKKEKKRKKGKENAAVSRPKIKTVLGLAKARSIVNKISFVPPTNDANHITHVKQSVSPSKYAPPKEDLRTVANATVTSPYLPDQKVTMAAPAERKKVLVGAIQDDDKCEMGNGRDFSVKSPLLPLRPGKETLAVTRPNQSETVEPESCNLQSVVKEEPAASHEMVRVNSEMITENSKCTSLQANCSYEKFEPSLSNIHSADKLFILKNEPLNSEARVPLEHTLPNVEDGDLSKYVKSSNISRNEVSSKHNDKVSDVSDTGLHTKSTFTKTEESREFPKTVIKAVSSSSFSSHAKQINSASLLPKQVSPYKKLLSESKASIKSSSKKGNRRAKKSKSLHENVSVKNSSRQKPVAAWDDSLGNLFAPDLVRKSHIADVSASTVTDVKALGTGITQMSTSVHAKSKSCSLGQNTDEKLAPWAQNSLQHDSSIDQPSISKETVTHSADIKLSGCSKHNSLKRKNGFLQSLNSSSANDKGRHSDSNLNTDALSSESVPDWRIRAALIYSSSDSDVDVEAPPEFGTPPSLNAVAKPRTPRTPNIIPGVSKHHNSKKRDKHFSEVNLEMGTPPPARPPTPGTKTVDQVEINDTKKKHKKKKKKKKRSERNSDSCRTNTEHKKNYVTNDVQKDSLSIPETDSSVKHSKVKSAKRTFSHLLPSSSFPPAKKQRRLSPAPVVSSENSDALSQVPKVTSTTPVVGTPVSISDDGPVGFYFDQFGNRVWVCPTCQGPDDGSPMIRCDDCYAWYHWTCVGIDSAPDENVDWFCSYCFKKKGTDLSKPKQSSSHRKKSRHKSSKT